LNKTGKALSYLGGGLILITFGQGIQKNNLNRSIIIQLEKQVQLQEDIINKFEKQKIEDFTNLSSKGLDINTDTDKVLAESNKISEISTNLNSTNLEPYQIEILNKDLNHHSSLLSKEINSSNKKLEELNIYIQDLFKSKDNFDGMNIFTDFQNYLSSLSNEKIGALGHILISIAIFYSILSIVFIFYGEVLIRYYNLEENYPKLARFIELRRKFQHYYFIFNISLISLSLLLIIYVNYLVFIN